MQKSIRAIAPIAALSFVLITAGCTQPRSEQAQVEGSSQSEGQPENRPASKPKAQVIATYSVLCDLTEQIAQTTVDLTCLIGAGKDPHVYSATPSDRRAIEEADLVLYGGYDFEPEIIQMIEATNTPTPKVAISELAVTTPLLGEHHEHGEEGHAEEEADPHVWHDAEHGIAMVKAIQTELTEVSPTNAALYETNAAALVAQLEKLDAWIQQQVNTVPLSGRTLISTHDALGYYAEAYGLEIEPALDSFSTEARPSAADIKALTKTVNERNVSSIFVESTSNPGLIDAVARETNIAVSKDPIYADGLGEANTPAESYQGMLAANTCTIVNGLGGRCDLASAQVFLPTK
jgi:manganese/iron transport system substrate-binding protein